MHVIEENMWDTASNYPLVLITGNAIVKSNGYAVMGAGAAKAALELYPEMAPFYGQKLTEVKERPYGILRGFQPLDYGPELGLFQTKNHWREDSTLDIIRYSVEKLMEILDEYEFVAINFPGIGKGNLNYDDVYQVIQPLPDKVHFFYLP